MEVHPTFAKSLAAASHARPRRSASSVHSEPFALRPSGAVTTFNLESSLRPQQRILRRPWPLPGPACLLAFFPNQPLPLAQLRHKGLPSISEAERTSHGGGEIGMVSGSA